MSHIAPSQELTMNSPADAGVSNHAGLRPSVLNSCAPKSGGLRRSTGTIRGTGPVTGRQREILRFIHDVRRALGWSPAYREIMERFQFASKNTVHDHLQALQKKGCIELPEKGRKRAIVLTPLGVATALGEDLAHPWEMTQDAWVSLHSEWWEDFIRERRPYGIETDADLEDYITARKPAVVESAKGSHRAYVVDAQWCGVLVPNDVQADYPEIFAGEAA